MKSKALLLGALPQAQEGPWVRIDDAEEWQADPRGQYGDGVVIELELADGGPPRSYPLGENIRMSGYRCRAVIEGPIDVQSVTVQLTQVR
jgi:hypothetical protein